MPEFILNTPRTAHPFYALDAFARGYVEAMFFTNGDTGDDNEHLLNELGVERLTHAAVADIKNDCDNFLGTVLADGCYVRQWIDRAADSQGYGDDQAGRDFWFSRQGHGVGFWDRDLGDVGDTLHEAASAKGEAYVEVYRKRIHHR